jgi:predicted O-methyltransferase YrrM
MRRPVVKEELWTLCEHVRRKIQGFEELEEFARQENIPIIPHETVAFFRILMQTLQPQKY